MNTQTQIVPDKLKDIELRLSDEPPGGKYVRHAYIKNRYVGTVIGQKSLYYIHFHKTVQRTAMWSEVGVILNNNYTKAYAPKVVALTVEHKTQTLDTTGTGI